MEYQLTYLSSEDAYRELYLNTYCDQSKPIISFDGITVKFFPERFEHAFFESVNRHKCLKNSFEMMTCSL